jgi:hypothetical protein
VFRAVLVACACGCGEATGDAAFDAERAFRDLRDLVALGPRPAGSPALEVSRGLIEDRLRQAGWRVERHAFEARYPAGQARALTNLIGSLDGARAGDLVLFVTHYDTKRMPGMRFVGANDGASGAAVLLELARVLARRSLVHSVRLVFCDGEEADGPTIHATDGLYGSRALAERMARDGSLARVRALVLVDMVGDADLELTRDLGDSPRLLADLREAAREAGLEALVEGSPALPIVDDHTPFVERGLEETLVLMDFQFGARRTPGPFWHTERDDLSAVSPASLNAVGRLAIGVFERLERR